MKNLFKNAMKKGIKIGFDEIEIYFNQSEKIELGVFENALDKYSKSKVKGLSIRGIKNGITGFAFTEKIDSESLDSAIEAAYENMKYIDSKDISVFNHANETYKDQRLYNPSFDSVDIIKKIDMLLKMEKYVFESSKIVDKVSHLIYGEIKDEEKIFNSSGMDLSQKRGLGYIYLDLILKDSDKFRTGEAYTVVRNFADLDPKDIVDRAIENGKKKLGAKSIDSGVYDVIFENTAFASILEAFTGLFIAERVQKGTSKLAGMIGEKIGSDLLTIVDDPYMKNGIANASFDAEGVKTKRKHVVQNGELMTYLYNIKTAIKDNVKTTGNAGRASYRSPIKTDVYNFYIEPGVDPLEEDIPKIKKCILIKELQGLHAGVNLVSCDFSLSAQGIMIEEGKETTPVSDITVSGNFLSMLKDIDKIYSDLKFGMPSLAYFGSPSVKVKNISIAGEK